MGVCTKELLLPAILFFSSDFLKEARAERRLQEGHEVQSTMIEVVCNDRLGKKVDVSFSGLLYARAA